MCRSLIFVSAECAVSLRCFVLIAFPSTRSYIVSLLVCACIAYFVCARLFAVAFVLFLFFLFSRITLGVVSLISLIWHTQPKHVKTSWFPLAACLLFFTLNILYSSLLSFILRRFPFFLRSFALPPSISCACTRCVAVSLARLFGLAFVAWCCVAPSLPLVMWTYPSHRVSIHRPFGLFHFILFICYIRLSSWLILNGGGECLLCVCVCVCASERKECKSYYKCAWDTDIVVIQIVNGINYIFM